MSNFVHNYIQVFDNIPSIVLKRAEVEQFGDKNTPDTNKHLPCVRLSGELDFAILRSKRLNHPDENITQIGNFAVLVQSTLEHKVCLPDIENRIRQLQMNRWRVEA